MNVQESETYGGRTLGCFRSWHLADNSALPAFVRYWTNSGQSWILARDGLSANDAVDGANTAASRWHRMVASKREIQRADVDGMKNASGAEFKI
jgi:hypothetical protein